MSISRYERTKPEETRRGIASGKGDGWTWATCADRPGLRDRAASANALVRMRARHHTQTETVAYTPVRGHNAAVNVLAFHGNPPLGREVLVFRDDWCQWVDPQRVVIERTA
jgi:hypothetical protein